MPSLAVIAIGRNEGVRLRACLAAALVETPWVVYVDSQSTDDSVATAESLGVHVIPLAMDVPFTAARARNAGLAATLERWPEVELIHFVDADTELIDGWMPAAIAAIDRDPKRAAVCGRRRERHPEQSIYNQLCDLEWNTPIGITKACGGDALFRAAALREVGGYNPGLIAGEEPELCVRLRRAGWTIERVNHDMTWHDAAMTRFGQWWKRNVRAGYAFAEGAELHGAPPERHWMKENRSNLVWGLVLPVGCIVGAIFTKGLALLALPMLDGLMIAKIARYGQRGRGMPGRLAWRWAFFIVLGKFPQARGAMQFYINRLLRRRGTLIEYKSAGVPAAR
jgi:hypothetical protein